MQFMCDDCLEQKWSQPLLAWLMAIPAMFKAVIRTAKTSCCKRQGYNNLLGCHPNVAGLSSTQGPQT